jgi:hypothetical protein
VHLNSKSGGSGGGGGGGAFCLKTFTGVLVPEKPGVWDALDRDKEWPVCEMMQIMYSLGDHRDVSKATAVWISQVSLFNTLIL